MDLCVCAFIPSPPIQTATRVVLFLHRAEARKSTNTGRIATECLANCQVVVRGNEAQPSEAFVGDGGSQPLLLFPHEDAVPLARFAGQRVTLVVPDGTWRQASKVKNRVPGMRDVPCVSLSAEGRSVERLRTEAHEGALSTIEAIARAMGILEGPAVREALERVFRVMVERTLKSRGVPGTKDVDGSRVSPL
jgi:DTW domain-containing protein YfiP